MGIRKPLLYSLISTKNISEMRLANYSYLLKQRDKGLMRNRIFAYVYIISKYNPTNYLFQKILQ